MNEVYITNYNLQNITSNVKEIVSSNTLQLPKVEELRRSFSALELSRFILIYKLLDNEDPELVAEIYNKYKRTKLEGSAYHQSPKCQQLNKNYIDLSWDTLDKGKVNQLEKEIAIYYDELVYGTLEHREQGLVIPQVLKKKYGVEDATLTLRKNSGHFIMENYSIQDIESRLQDVLLESEGFRASDPEVSKEIAKYTYGTDRWHVPKNRPVMYQWKNYKDKITELLIGYIRLNSSGETDKNLLRSLNMHPCRTCMLK